MSRALWLIATLTMSGIASAQDATPCKVFDSELQGSYAGGCVAGLAEGQGTAAGAARYSGEFKAGRKHGNGVKAWPNGDRYEGQFVEDKKSGTGTYTWGAGSASPGERYAGEWVDDRRNGRGVYEWPNGDRYDGTWKNDRLAGAPTQAMIDRARVEAERAAAVGKPGAKVCRQMTVGIATKDWVRGTVVSLDAGALQVRIDDAGKFEHIIGSKTVTKAEVISDSPQSWVPCT